MKAMGLSFDLDEEIDHALVELSMPGSDGLMDRFPPFGRLGARKVPRAWRCLQGWSKFCPSRSRLAYPLGVVLDKLDNGGPCSCSQSSFQPPPGLDLPPARCFVEAEKDGACQADGPLVNSDEPCRDLVNRE